MPSVTVPANFSIAGPSAATRTGGAVAPGCVMGRKALVVTCSPSLLTVSPRNIGIRESRYSRM